MKTRNKMKDCKARKNRRHVRHVKYVKKGWHVRSKGK